MRRLFRKAWFIALVAVLLITPVAVWAASVFTRSVPATVTVIATNPDLRVYADAGATQELTTIAYGNIVQGNAGSQTVYVKNTGNVAYTSVNATNTLSNTVGTLTPSPDGYALSAGAIQQVSLSLSIKSASPSGNQSFSINFNGTY